MSSVQLLDDTRRIGRLLHGNHSGKVVFNDLCKIVSEILHANVLVISRKGKILGLWYDPETQVLPLAEKGPEKIGSRISQELAERFLSVLSTNDSANLETLGFSREAAERYHTMLLPTQISGKRLGTILVYRSGSSFDIDDIILCEFAVTVVGLEMMRAVSEESEEEYRKEKTVRSALETLSRAERQSVIHMMDELHGMEGMVVASKIADDIGITRSVIVNSLRKLESAGIIETRSAGMRGTFIRIRNDALMAEIEHLQDGESNGTGAYSEEE